ncbi:MAG TPA: zinc-ribbon domain-containing protein, partial [Polyangiaceae bacterium]
MFKVECPGCKAPYQVDERRVPSSGLKMRCPKCGTSFQVEPPDDGRRTGPSPVLGESASQTAAGGAPRVPARQNPAARTIVGVAPSALGLPPLGAPKQPPPVPQRPAPAERPQPPEPPPQRVAAPAADPYAGADLPAVGRPKGPPPVPTRPKPAVPAGAPAVPAAAPAPQRDDADLPAPVTRRAAPAGPGAGTRYRPSRG